VVVVAEVYVILNDKFELFSDEDGVTGVSDVAVVRLCCLVSVGFDAVINSDDLMSCVIPIVCGSKEIFVGDKS